jgi:AraC family transcriptional regulator
MTAAAMPAAPGITLVVEAEAQTRAASVQLAEITVGGSYDLFCNSRDSLRVQLGLFPPSISGSLSYPDRWGAGRCAPVGALTLLPPGETVRIRLEPHQTHRFVVCHCSAKLLESWTGSEMKWSDRQLQEALNMRDAILRRALQQLAMELMHPSIAGELLLEALTMQVAVGLARYYVRTSDAARSGGLTNWRLRLIDERLNRRGTWPTIAELAAICKISPRQLLRAFRAARGFPLGEYLQEHRFNRARQLLEEGASVKATAYELGFSSSASFCYSFRRAAGETPKLFKERIAQQFSLADSGADFDALRNEKRSRSPSTLDV